MKKILSPLLCLVTLALLSASAFAGDYSFVSDKGVKLQYPKESWYFEEPFEATVQSGKKDGSIYIMPAPQADNGHLGMVSDGETVFILAEKSGFYFFETEEGYHGWNGKKWFKTYDEEPDKRSTQNGSTVSSEGVALEFPEYEDLYTVPFVLFVKSSKTDGTGSIYLMPKPEAGNGNLGRVKDGEAVLILAIHEGYYFFETSDGRQGWNGTKWFVS